MSEAPISNETRSGTTSTRSSGKEKSNPTSPRTTESDRGRGGLTTKRPPRPVCLDHDLFCKNIISYSYYGFRIVIHFDLLTVWRTWRWIAE